MKKIRITYIKTSKIQYKPDIIQMLEQTIHTDKAEFTIPVYPGYTIMSVTEVMQDIIDKVPPQIN